MATLTKQQYKVVWCSDQWGWCVTTLVTAYPGEGLDGNPIRATIIVAICARKSDAEALAAGYNSKIADRRMFPTKCGMPDCQHEATYCNVRQTDTMRAPGFYYLCAEHAKKAVR